jgi:hypothetical protein
MRRRLAARHHTPSSPRRAGRAARLRASLRDGLREALGAAATAALVALGVGHGGCGGGPPDLIIEATFESGADGFAADFADYPVEDTVADPTLYDLESGLADMPLAGGGQRGFRLAGTNRSDDLWMALVRRVDGLTPQATYAVAIEVDVASNVGSGCVGVGGAPGESLFIKAGASGDAVTEGVGDDGRNRVWLKPDKGNQSQVGADSVSLGNIATGLECGDETWVLLKRSGELEATADAAGAITLFVGTDSGFEGRTELFYDRLRFALTQQD